MTPGKRVKNVVTFLGPEGAVKKLRRKLWRECTPDRDIVFNPEAVLPLPDQVTRQRDREAFCREYWGCAGMFCNDSELDWNRVSFESWEHPPRKVFRHLSELYPDITVLVEFAPVDGICDDGPGQIVYKDGKETETCMLSFFADILVNYVKGKPFRIKDSYVYNQAPLYKETGLADAVRRLRETEWFRLQALLCTGALASDDFSVVREASTVRETERILDGLAELEKTVLLDAQKQTA